MTTRARLLSFALLLLLAVPAAAYRREYVVSWGGKRMAGSEVCFYRGVRGDGFTLFLSPTDVRCLPADAILDFPPGVIHAFARHKDGYATLQRDFTVYDGPPSPEQGYERLETALVRAGYVDFGAVVKHLGPKERIGLWIGSTPASLSTFIPLIPGETSIIAPAGAVLVPLMIENGAPVRAGEPLYLEPGERQSASFDRTAGGSDVVIAVRLDNDSVNDARSLLAAPEIALKSGDRIIHPVAPLYGPEESALLFFPHVPAGGAEVIVDGSMWRPVSRTIDVLPQPVTVVREPLPLVAGGSIEVHWTGSHPVASGCDEPRTPDVPLLRASLLRCTASGCSTVTNAAAPFLSAAGLTFKGIPSGSYTVTVDPPDAKRQTVSAEAIAGRRTTVDVKLSTFDFFGSVRMNGKPVQARLIFDSGQAISDADGHYAASLAGDPHGAVIHVEPCHGDHTYTVIPRAAPLSNTAYDIDVNPVRLRVRVVDAQRRPVMNAAVHYAPVRQLLADGNELWFHSPEKSTGHDGVIDFDDLPEGSLVALCATHKDFADKCSAPIDPNRLEDQFATVQFDPVAMHGRIAGHSGRGSIDFVSPAGTVTEEAALGADGGFLMRSMHAAPEHAVYVSDRHPLVVLPLPPASNTELLLQVPSAPVRTFTVTVPDNRNDMGLLGMWVGGMYVPVQALNTHLEMRGLDAVIHRDAMLRVADIAETGTISVAFGALPAGSTEFVDPFTLPQYAGVERHRVDGAAIVLTP